MATYPPSVAAPRPARLLAVVAWSATLLVSALPPLVWAELAVGAPSGLLWARIVLLAVLLGAAWLRTPLRPLRGYLLALFVLVLGYGLRDLWAPSPAYDRWEAGVTWPGGMAVLQAIVAGVASALVLALLAAGYRRRPLFLSVGDLRACAEPLSWEKPTARSPWSRAGTVFCVAVFAGGLLYLAHTNTPSSEQARNVLPILPAVVAIASANALSEEISVRGCLLGALHEAIGKPQTLLLNALFFGLAHYSGGFPAGLPWFLITMFLGWWFGRSMLETRGLGWPSVQHVAADVPVRAFSAMTSLAAACA